MSDEVLTLIIPLSERHIGLFNDIKNDSRVKLYYTNVKDNNILLKWISKIILSKKVNRLFKLKKFSFFYDYKKVLKQSNLKRVLIMDAALNNISFNFLKKLKRKGIIVDLYFINSLEAKSPTIAEVKKIYKRFKWNHIFTFDPIDANKYNLEFLGFNYYSKIIMENSYNTNCDVFFVGGLKGEREKEIFSLYDYLCVNNIKSTFYLNVYGNNKVTRRDGINFVRKWIPYKQIVDCIMHSKCVIEILQKNQHGTSLRYFEAVCYNKKLLTNNKDIVNYPFYNPKYMKIFTNINDIDINWIREDINIEYNYNDEFSPKHLVEYLISSDINNN